ncbi:MAG: hypothetical protein HYV27_12995 [Candidatus Hydrogenedentes bacterium]|nr:hypothetical protein [Candidatus Hydrogenedentota bacterium]
MYFTKRYSGSSLALCLLGMLPAMVAPDAPAAGVALSGTVRYTGKVPERRFADNEGRQRPLLLVDGATGGLAYAAVWLRPVAGGAALPEMEAPAQRAPLSIAQIDGEFMPMVAGVVAGQRVSIGNEDVSNHNVHTFAANPENEFNVITPPGSPHERVVEAEPDDTPIRLSCDLHPWMMGWIYVFGHPCFAVTDEKGHFAIEGVPPGTYELVAAQPAGKLRAAGSVEVKAETPVSVAVNFSESGLGGTTPGTVNVEGETADGPAEIAALTAELALLKGMLPDQAHAMQDVGFHFANLWFAGEHGNWPLAAFYLAETRSHLKWAVRIRPIRQTQAGDLDLNSILEAIDGSLLSAVQAAIDAGDRAGFESAYRSAAEGCYACHKASEKPFLRPQIPESPPERIINFDPGAVWPQ